MREQHRIHNSHNISSDVNKVYRTSSEQSIFIKEVLAAFLIVSDYELLKKVWHNFAMILS